MGTLEIITLIMMLLSYFTAKKTGADDTEAALVAAGAGLGTYYVGTQTEWGKDLVATLDNSWTSLMDGDEPVKQDGKTVTAPPGAVPEKNPDGSYKTDSNGNILWKLLDTTGKVVGTTGSVLESWGPTGTAAVVGAAGIASGNKNWLIWGGVALGVLLLLK